MCGHVFWRSKSFRLAAQTRGISRFRSGLATGRVIVLHALAACSDVTQQTLGLNYLFEKSVSLKFPYQNTFFIG